MAAAAPDAPALSDGGQVLTYAELERRAGALATRLAGHGVAAEVPVGICLDRSFDQIVALLAVLKAGGAFVPLDPDWPDARLHAIASDCGMPLVIAQPEHSAAFNGAGCRVVNPESSAGAAAAFAAAPRRPGDLAYLIYTSGSTGTPKGVEITDANLSNLIDWHCRAFDVTASDRAAYAAGLGFDASVWELWPYLCAGATVVLAPDAVRRSPGLLQRWLVEERVTIAFATSSLAEPMIAAAWPEDTALRFLLTGAEPLHRRPCPALPFAVVNNYGPTEATVVATSTAIAPAGSEDGILPIGRPIANTTLHLLGDGGDPVAPGETGEIYIGGGGVARGYRNRPGLTGERFVADPFGPPGARLYRTGDLGVMLPDGLIAFRGRCDAQEKIRGYRIEPDEIVHALDRHLSVLASAVVARDGAERGRHLVAYVVPDPADAPSAEELGDFLGETLPAYMVPSVFVRLDALPLTSNGKLDRAALPDPSEANSLNATRFRAPASGTEIVLGRIVAGVLGVERVGADDNFFLLGGHSLLGTQVVLRAREAFGVEITLRDLFEAPTVARLAGRVELRLLDRLGAMSEAEAELQLAV